MKFDELQYVTSVGRSNNSINKQQKFYTHYLNDAIRFDVSSNGLIVTIPEEFLE
jgi:hypothetical protein